MPGRVRRASFGSMVLLLAACGRSPATPAPSPPSPLIRPIQIDSVHVHVEGAQVSADVRGVIGDGCTELFDGVTMRRAEASVTVEILSQRPAHAICTQIAKLYAETLRLPGEFPSGRYALRVNSFETTFDVP